MNPCDDLLSQLFQQRLRLLQIFRVKAFGEPAVDLGQHPVSFLFLALLLAQSTQAHHRSQLQRLRLLPTGNFNRLEEARFGLFRTMNSE